MPTCTCLLTKRSLNSLPIDHRQIVFFHSQVDCRQPVFFGLCVHTNPWVEGCLFLLKNMKKAYLRNPKCRVLVRATQRRITSGSSVSLKSSSAYGGIKDALQCSQDRISVGRDKRVNLRQSGQKYVLRETVIKLLGLRFRVEKRTRKNPALDAQKIVQQGRDSFPRCHLALSAQKADLIPTHGSLSRRHRFSYDYGGCRILTPLC